MPHLVSQQPPPADYYAANLRLLLTEVSDRYHDLLDADDRRFVSACLSASIPALRLFARLLSRRGPWIRVDSLDYPEVSDSGQALEELKRAGLVAVDPVAPADALLNLLTRPELNGLYPSIRERTKVEFINRCVVRYTDCAIRRRLQHRIHWVCANAFGSFNVCRLLYFGYEQQDLSAFVVQDLGILRYEPYEIGANTRPFDVRAQLDGYLRLRGLSVLSRRVDTVPGLASQLLLGLWAEPGTRAERRQRNKILLRLARWHERRGELDEALQCYGRVTAHPARVRRVRILKRLGDDCGANQLVSQIAAAPWGAEEEDLARRHDRKRDGQKRLGLTRLGLTRPGLTRLGRTRPDRNQDRNGPLTTLCQLSGAVPAGIEAHARRLLASSVGTGWHLENRLPLGLAGLLYWDEIYAPVKGAFTHRFQLGPRDLFWPDFAPARQTLLQARTEMLSSPGAIARRLKQVRAAKTGTANLLVSWQAFSPQLVTTLAEQVPAEALLRLAARTIDNLYRLRTGFPDLLMVYGPGAYEFVEVKGPGDQLQPAQRVWLRELDELGLPNRVLSFLR